MQSGCLNAVQGKSLIFRYLDETYGRRRKSFSLATDRFGTQAIGGKVRQLKGSGNLSLLSAPECRALLAATPAA
jgi:hypothetical protein